jgi:hypothetical protein
MHWGSSAPETLDLSLILSSCHGKTNLFYFIWPPYSQRSQKCDWKSAKLRMQLISWTPSLAKPDWTGVGEQKHLIGWTPGPKTWLDESGRVKAPDRLNSRPQNLIGREWESESTWLAELPAPKTWLDESGRVKSPDWLNSQSWRTWLDESGTAKVPDRLNSQSLKTWLDESGTKNHA